MYWFVSNNSLILSSSRLFRTQSHWSYFAGRCTFSEQLLPVHLTCRMCNQYTFYHQFGIDTWRSKIEQQTDSILSACGSMDKKQKDLETIKLNAPRHAQYMHEAWKRHQNTVYWVDINLDLKKRLKFYQTRSNAIILHETLPAYRLPKVVRMETGEVIYEKVYASPRLPLKISLEHDWMTELGSEDAQRPDGQVMQHFKSTQSNQPTTNPDHDRTGQPVVGTNPRIASSGRKTSRSQEIETRSFHEEAVKHERTVQPVVENGSNPNTFLSWSTRFNVGGETIQDRKGQPVVNRDESGHEQTMLNEVNMDFGILGLPHSVVKQAESSRVHELVKKIENHPDRHALQQDLEQSNVYNPFSATSKKMIQEVAT